MNERKIRKHFHINKEYLLKEYIENGRSSLDIANENGVKAKLIIERLIRFNIPPRTIKESNVSIISTEKRRKTCFEKYGTDNISKLKETTNKIQNNTDKELHRKKTSIALKKRTKEEWKESYRKRAITFLQKYGVENVSQLPLVKRKIRLNVINRIQNQIVDGGQVYPFYNPNACKLIDEYGKQNGYNFQHALNGGEHYIKELGYWVDGYDKEKNVVIEIDESHHFDRNGQLLKKDIDRQKEIEDFLRCKFIRLNYE